MQHHNALQFLLVCALLAIIQSKVDLPTKPKVSAAVKDTTLGGLEGFNFEWAFPHKVQDYVVGLVYKFGDMKKAPEYLFAKRSFDTFADGSLSVDAQYYLEDQCFNLYSKLDIKGFTVDAEADTVDTCRLKNVGVSKDLTINDNKLTFNAAYNLLKKTFSGSSKIAQDDSSLKLSYDSGTKDAQLALTHKLDDSNELNPSLSLKTGDIVYGWTRKWNGGSLKSKLFLNDKVAFEWKDEGANGAWTTKAEVPLKGDSQPKVSFSRDWVY